MSLLSVDNLILRNEHEGDIEKKRKKIFRKFEAKIDHHCNGDHLFLLALHQKYLKTSKKEKFSEKLGLNHKYSFYLFTTFRKMEDALEIRKQLITTLNDLKLSVSTTKDMQVLSQRFHFP